jgi:hypothetical protein
MVERGRRVRGVTLPVVSLALPPVGSLLPLIGLLVHHF